MGVKAKSLSLNLPFGMGGVQFVPDEMEQQAAWELYVELRTRISTEALQANEGLIREAMNSLYKLFDITRAILKTAGPRIGQGKGSLGDIALTVLNKGLRPFLSKWHPQLQAYEQTRPEAVSPADHERNWAHHEAVREELTELQKEMQIYVKALAKIAGVDDDDMNEQ